MIDRLPTYEGWLSIPGYEDLYWASNFGRIMNARGQIKNQRVHESANKTFYYKVDLYKDNKRKTFRVNRLILMAFKGMPPEKNVACHKNGNTLCNWIENLRWDTQQFNVHDYWNRKREAEDAKHQL